jgi:hypothetical protein
VATTKGIQSQFSNSIYNKIADVKLIVEKTADVFDRESQKLATACISPACNVEEMDIRLIPATLKRHSSNLFSGTYPI